jgi:hypothetical protein
MRVCWLVAIDRVIQRESLMNRTDRVRFFSAFLAKRELAEEKDFQGIRSIPFDGLEIQD